jgi:hypothetical protein
MLATGWDKICTRLHHFTSYKASSHGVVMVWGTSHIRMNNLVMVGNKNGIVAMPGLGKAQRPFMRIARSSIHGHDCKEKETCDNISHNECSYLRGILHPNSQAMNRAWPEITTHFYNDLKKFPFERFKSNPVYQEGKYVVRNVEFKNFNDFQPKGQASFKCNNNFAYTANKYNADLAPLLTMARIQTENTPVKNFAKFYDPNPEWLKYRHYNCYMVQCFAPNNVLVRILDDSVLNVTKGATLISNNPGIIQKKQCTRMDAWNGYYCNNTQYSLVVFETMDKNRNLRVQNPITFKTLYGYNNTVSPMMDKSTSSYDISGKRFPRFSVAVRKNQHYYVDMTGSRPQEWRW